MTWVPFLIHKRVADEDATWNNLSKRLIIKDDVSIMKDNSWDYISSDVIVSWDIIFSSLAQKESFKLV